MAYVDRRINNEREKLRKRELKSETEPVFSGKEAQRYDSWFETAAGRYAEHMENELLRRLMPEISKKYVLDIGCGTGSYLIKFTSEAQLAVGVDISHAMIRRAQKKPSSRIRYVIADAHRLPFRENVFDFVFWITSLEFFSHPVDALAEGFRVGKGEALLAVLNKWSLSSLWRRIKALFQPSVFQAAAFYTPSNLRKMSHKALGGTISFRWLTTMVTFPIVPQVFQPILKVVDQALERSHSPFGAFLAVRMMWNKEEASGERS